MVDGKMSDDCGGDGGNIIGGNSFDCSCDTQTSNDYSPVNDCSSNVQTDNDYPDSENVISAVENALELDSNMESTKLAVDHLKTASTIYSLTKLQADDVTSVDKCLKSQSIRDVRPNNNYIKTNGRMGKNHSANYVLSNTNRNRMKEERWKNYSKMSNRQNHFRRTFFGMLIVSIVMAFLFIITVYIIIFANYPSSISERTSIYKRITIKPLPEGA